MNFRIQDISKSFVTEFVFGFLYSALITCQISDAIDGGRLSIWALSVVSFAGLMFVGWLIWLLRKYISGRRIIPMPGKPGRVAEAVNTILLIMWIVVHLFDRLCHPAMAVVAWCLLVASTGYYIFYCNKYGFTD